MIIQDEIACPSCGDKAKLWVEADGGTVNAAANTLDVTVQPHSIQCPFCHFEHIVTIGDEE